jgi:hypothetical protein
MVSSKEFSSLGNRSVRWGVTAYRSPSDLAVQNLGWVIWQVIPRWDSSLVVAIVVAPARIVVASVGPRVFIEDAALIVSVLRVAA